MVRTCSAQYEQFTPPILDSIPSGPTVGALPAQRLGIEIYKFEFSGGTQAQHAHRGERALRPYTGPEGRFELPYRLEEMDETSDR